MSATATPATEEYLQAIYTLDDEGTRVISARLSGFLGVTPAAVSEMVHRLEREGLVTLDDRKAVGLSSQGRQIAERIEHAMSDEMEERLTRVLGNPETCPHGNPMPGVTPRPTRTLDSLRPGTASPVERIPDQFEHEPGFLEYLDSVGIKPGVLVTLVSVDDARLRVSIEGKERDLRRDAGRKVLVRV